MRANVMKSYRISILEGLAFLQLCATSFALDYYVSSVHGSARNPESLQSPLATISQAQNLVRKAVASQHEDINVYIADGVYSLETTLNFTSEDSGNNGFKVNYIASGSQALISGGTKLSNWALNSTTGIYSTNVPVGTVSRNLYVGGMAAQYARTKLDRGDFTFTNNGLTWTSPGYDWITSLSGIGSVEIRGLGSFTDRYSPVASAGDQALVMKQNAWINNLQGYDTLSAPFQDEGFFIQNSLDLLTLGGEYYLDSAAGKVYYLPLTGQDMKTIDTYLGRLEVLMAIGGIYDSPAHDITFQGLQFAHTTWNRPTAFGYVDQQSGGYWGNNITYPVNFEASRPNWYQMPSGIQISAANNIAFTNGNFSQFGAGGLGIGNDAEAHITGIGLGASNITVADSYFTQIMGNSITGGGIQADAHHPTDPRMINSKLEFTGNIFYNTSSLFTGCAPIFVSYVQYSTIAYNDISATPWAGICHGYGWGSNDAGGNPAYMERGLYNYQPLYTTPTTSLSNTITGNLVHAYVYELTRTDVGGLYTLSDSPSTVFTDNYVYDSTGRGLMLDEGSRSLTYLSNVAFSEGVWYYPNPNPTAYVGNNTLIDSFGYVGDDTPNAINGSTVGNDTLLRNYVLVNGLTYASARGLRTAYRAGILPASRGSRPVSNGAEVDFSIGIYFQGDNLIANLSNFDDLPFTGVSFKPTVSDPYTLFALSGPSTIPGNSNGIATWSILGSGCLPPTVSMTVKYTNSRTKTQNTVSQIATRAGVSTLDNTFKSATDWYNSAFGQTCQTYGITASGRDIYTPTDDWAALYKSAPISDGAIVTAYVQSIDPSNPWTKSGIVVRNNLTANALGYAALVITPGNGISLLWDNDSSGILTQYDQVADSVTAPLFLRLEINGTSIVGAYSKDLSTWVDVGSAELTGRNATLYAGLVHSSHQGFLNSTALFSNFTVTLT
ncbi:uncharacterized protein PAC_00133 [Phialocephala subalpina]|uniref:Right handed beta helix domain-containing protein n=1 Tax=Phialocephala subalpina TaxID=576137 RepID=A0A1L7WBU7_9HELO|nr:uncharacterized protein PAC_00133 [Phialocephala subalpina]